MLKIKKLVKPISIVLASLLAFASCEVGLGEAIDMTAPSVEIYSPKATAIVKNNLAISGIATDNEGVKSIEVTVAPRDMVEQKFRWEGVWQEYAGGKWIDYPNATITGSKQKYEFTIFTEVILPPGVYKKEVTITTLVTDVYSNEGSSRKDERLITIDGKEPNAKIAAPALFKTYEEAEEFSKNNAKLCDNSVLKSLYNGDVEFKVNQTENTRLGLFTVILDGEKTLEVPSVEDTPDLSTISSYYCKTIDGSRNFSHIVNHADLKDEVKKGKTIFRVVTSSFDEAGNPERTAHGFFIYWQEADKPWTELSLGDKEYIEGVDQKEVYPSCEIQGYAYDDDGLKTVEITVEIYDANTHSWIKDETRSQIINYDKDENPTSVAWTVNALAESKHFRITSTAIDVNETKGEPVTKYFRISDVSPPTITVKIEPDADSLLGYPNGNSNFGKIKISGTAEDDGKINSIKMVRIANKNRQNFLSYYNASDDGWTKTTNENVLIDFTPVSINDGSGGYWQYSFEKEIDLFASKEAGGFCINGTGYKTEFVQNVDRNELKISPDSSTESIKNHILIFRVEDESGAAAIETFSYQGDIEAPSLTIDNIYVVPKIGGSCSKVNGTKYDVNSTNALPTFKRDSQTQQITDMIFFTGTWSDNSYTHWGDINKIGKVILYNNKGEVAKVTMKIDGTWESDLCVPEDTTTASVQAILTDWGGNTTKVQGSYYVSSSNPTLLRINSTNPDGTYKNGDEITLVMEYNKKVTIQPGTKMPQLVLNNNGIANYVSGNGESKHYYKYIVGSTTGETALPSGTKLKVQSLSVNNNSWKDSDNNAIENPATLTGYNLDQVRSIYLDNGNPRVVNIKAVTGSGYYRAGKELFFQAEFNKDVSISNLGNVKLKVNIFGKDENGKDKIETEIPAVSMPSTKTVLFKYTVTNNDNTFEQDGTTPAKLKFISFIGGENNILDIAENPMINFNSTDTKDYIAAQEIYIDTKQPAKPVISGIVDNGLYYSDINSITFGNFESQTKATRYYSFDDGKSWKVYDDSKASEVKIDQNGTFQVRAKQIDLAGNESVLSDPITVTLDKGNLVTSITTINPDGTYKKDNVIDIEVSFRKEVVASGAKLNLNVETKTRGSANRQAILDTSTSNVGTKKLHFKYTVGENDFCEHLNVKGEIEFTDAGYIKDWIGGKEGTTVASKTVSGNVSLADINPLTTSRDIRIVNGQPYVTSVTLTKPTGAGEKERELRITFNSEITKQASTKKEGNADTELLYITLEQASGFEAPAILTSAQFNDYPVAVKKFYKETSNGWIRDSGKNTGKVDLSSKYVLLYEKDTDDTTLVNALKEIYVPAKHNVSPTAVPVPMGSNYVKVDPSDKKVLVVSLKDDYTLPVMGADYNITIPAQIVENNIYERNKEVKVYSTGSGSAVTENFAEWDSSMTDSKYVLCTRTNPGVERPVIRVNKKNESISGTTVTQPATTNYKISCQTPSVTIKYRQKASTPGCMTLTRNNDDDHVKWMRSGSQITSDPGFDLNVATLPAGYTTVTPTDNKTSKVEGTIGSDITTTNAITSITGYKVLIEAVASKGTNQSESAYEAAMRTVIGYAESDSGASINDGSYNSRWIRGGDNISGGVSTPDFPLTWDGQDWAKFGTTKADGSTVPRTVRAMTAWGSGQRTWYWVTWNINTTAYVHFIGGDMPSDADAKGPKKWWWSSCGFTSLKSQMPVYPGECSYFPTDSCGRYGGYKFLSGGTDGKKHQESR